MKTNDKLLESTWSDAVAFDPKHRPQTLDKPASTARREWARWPQEAHLLDEANNRFRRLTSEEVAIIQGFDPSWVDVPDLSEREKIAALGNAVPPPLARAIFRGISKVWKWQNKTSIEICAGIGGLAQAVSDDSDFQHIALIENWEPGCRILRNRPEWSPEAVFADDVQKFDFAAHAGKIGVLAGGPPCQPWSQAGQKRGAKDPRDILGLLPDMVGACMPEVLVIENVPGLVTNAQNAEYLEDLLERLEEPGDGEERYGLAKGILLAADFGVPQLRKRLFILGFRGKSHTFASKVLQLIESGATHCSPTRSILRRKYWVTLEEAFKGVSDPGGWRRYRKEPIGSGKAGESDSKELHAAETVGQDDYEAKSQIKVQAADQFDAAIPDRYSRIELSWPGKDEVPFVDDGKWKTAPLSSMVPRYPLLSGKPTKGKKGGKKNLAITGNQIQALQALDAYLTDPVVLLYFEPYRVELLPAGESGMVNSIWMSVLRETAIHAKPLLGNRGVIVVQVEDRSYHYARTILEEVFGAKNYICTVVWQKKYGPQNDLNVPTDAQDYLIVFSKRTTAELPVIGLPAKDDLADDGDPRGPWRAGHKGARSGTEDSKFEVCAPPYRWRVAEGELPDGLWRLNEYSGVIWGVPERAGEFSFRVEVSDAAGSIALRKITIRIAADGKPSNPESVWWIFKDTSRIASGGRLKATAKAIFNGVVGQPFSAILTASGGVPFEGKNMKPGRGRYWEFSRKTLVREVLADNVHFGSKGNALPSVKKHTPAGETRDVRITTWWPYEVAGKAEDATRHLKQLAEKGLIQEPPRISKPELLFKRLVQLFARGESASVISIGDSTASFTTAAIKLGKRAIHLAGGLPGEMDTWSTSGMARIAAVLKGQDDLGISNDEDVNWRGGGQLQVFSVGPEFMSSSRNGERVSVNLEGYPPSSARFKEAICSMLGFAWDPKRKPEGINDRGDLCVILGREEVLTEMKLSELIEKYSAEQTRLTVAYERSTIIDNALTHKNVRLVRVPFELPR